MNNEQNFKLSDNVIARICQIVTEGMMTLTDVTDHMRMMRLEEGENGELQLTAAYQEQVLNGHLKINEEATKLAMSKDKGEG